MRFKDRGEPLFHVNCLYPFLEIDCSHSRVSKLETWGPNGQVAVSAPVGLMARR
jgi:hypothetical protein